MQGKARRNPQGKRRLARLATMLLLAAALFGKGGVQAASHNQRSSPQADQSGSASASPAAAQELYKLTNQERESAGLPTLQWDDRLAQAALAHAQLMVEHGELAHQFSGEPPVRDRIAATNLHFGRSGENVAYDDNAQDANRGLMNSPPHRANILNPDYNAIGIAAVQAGDRLYVVEDFAGRLPDYSTSKVEEIITRELEQVRARNDLAPLARIADAGLRAQACDMAREDHLSATGLRSAQRPRFAVSYTATDPARLPSDAMNPTLDPRIRAFSLGACYAKSASHPNALYWVALTFY